MHFFYFILFFILFFLCNILLQWLCSQCFSVLVTVFLSLSAHTLDECFQSCNVSNISLHSFKKILFILFISLTLSVWTGVWKQHSCLSLVLLHFIKVTRETTLMKENISLSVLTWMTFIRSFVRSFVNLLINLFINACIY